MRFNWRILALCVVLLAATSLIPRIRHSTPAAQSPTVSSSLETSRRHDIYKEILNRVEKQVVPPTKLIAGSFGSCQFTAMESGKLRVEIPMTGILPESVSGAPATLTAIRHFKTLAEVQRMDEIRAFSITSLQLVATSPDHKEWIGIPKTMRVD